MPAGSRRRAAVHPIPAGRWHVRSGTGAGPVCSRVGRLLQACPRGPALTCCSGLWRWPRACRRPMSTRDLPCRGWSVTLQLGIPSGATLNCGRARWLPAGGWSCAWKHSATCTPPAVLCAAKCQLVGAGDPLQPKARAALWVWQARPAAHHGVCRDEGVTCGGAVPVCHPVAGGRGRTMNGARRVPRVTG